VNTCLRVLINEQTVINIIIIISEIMIMVINTNTYLQKCKYFMVTKVLIVSSRKG